MFAISGNDVEHIINGARRAALRGAIEGEIPTTAVVVMILNPQVTSRSKHGGQCM